MSDKKWIKESAGSRNWDSYYNLMCPDCGATYRGLSGSDLISYRYCPTCGIELYDKKLEKISEYAVQLLIDEIRMHRKKFGLDPAWCPPEEWLTEKYKYCLEFFGSISEDEVDEEKV